MQKHAVFPGRYSWIGLNTEWADLQKEIEFSHQKIIGNFAAEYCNQEK